MSDRPHLLVCPPEDWRDTIDLKQASTLEAIKFLARKLGMTLRVDDAQGKVYLGRPDEGNREVVTDGPGPPGQREPVSHQVIRPGMLSLHFSQEEFRDGLGRLEHLANLRQVAAKLEKLRIHLKDRPINVTSGYRSPEWNARVGGVPNSYHVRGLAADIWVDGLTVEQLAQAAEAVGFGGIGRYFRQEFVHVDLGPTARWTD